jgi:hypothetical protein
VAKEQVGARTRHQPSFVARETCGAQEPTEGLAAAAQNPVAARIGGGIGKIVRIGTQPINGGLQIFDYIKRPGSEPNWAVLFQAPLLFSC